MAKAKTADMVRHSPIIDAEFVEIKNSLETPRPQAKVPAVRSTEQSSKSVGPVVQRTLCHA